MSDALFAEDGGAFVPSEHTRGPWDPRAQHGGAPAALLGRAIERLPTDVPMQVARITVDLLRPVPMAPMRVAARVLRPGRRVQLAEADATVDGEVVCRATAWRIRAAEFTFPASDVTSPVIGNPGTARPFIAESDQPALHRTGMEIRFSHGAFETPGDATAWFRLRYPVVAGETPSPLQRVLAAADFGNGISSAFEFLTFLYVNTDLTVHLHRLPAGEWVCLAAHTSVEPTGIGLAQSALYDERGPLGRSLQSLLIDALPGQSPAGL